jgi:hypothetical protein
MAMQFAKQLLSTVSLQKDLFIAATVSPWSTDPRKLLSLRLAGMACPDRLCDLTQPQHELISAERV